MGIVVTAYTVFVRRDSIESLYPDGVEGFRRDCPTGMYCDDGHLCSVSFMIDNDGYAFIEQLKQHGLRHDASDAMGDIVAVGQNNALECECSWMQFAEYEDIIFGWLSGTSPNPVRAPGGFQRGNQIQRISTEEACEHLEFVRREGDIDVYRDRRTGKELFAHRTTQHDALADSPHSTRPEDTPDVQLYKKAMTYLEHHMVFHGVPTGKVGWMKRRNIKKGLSMLQDVVVINPQHWPAIWCMGKVHQTLGDHRQALSSFEQAHQINPDQADVLREATISALESGEFKKGVVYAEWALDARPGDAGLRSNLALALVMVGQTREAMRQIEKSLADDPDDRITRGLAARVQEVLDGQRPQPRAVSDLMK